MAVSCSCAIISRLSSDSTNSVTTSPTSRRGTGGNRSDLSGGTICYRVKNRFIISWAKRIHRVCTHTLVILHHVQPFDVLQRIFNRANTFKFDNG